MTYTGAVQNYPATTVASPGVAALQRAVLWLVGFGGAFVLIEPSPYEFAMLYGIQRNQQLRLAREGIRLRVLISYGEYWFPWYMRRLAERPANVWFVIRTLWG